MPSIVPAGYTRGTIMFLTEAAERYQEERLLQFFWDEAGGYGARIALIATDTAAQTEARRIADIISAWEVDSVVVHQPDRRRDAQERTRLAPLDRATAILLVGTQPTAMAAQIGGTALAQAVRRANAHGKVVGAHGSGAAILCQHMIVTPPVWAPTAPEFVHFAPGLGLVNRLALDSVASPSPATAIHRLRLAVAHNPFLVAVTLERPAALAVYADTTMELFGEGAAWLADGSAVERADLLATADSVDHDAGIALYRLQHGGRYNFDTRTVQPLTGDDLPDGVSAAGGF